MERRKNKQFDDRSIRDKLIDLQLSEDPNESFDFSYLNQTFTRGKHKK